MIASLYIPYFAAHIMRRLNSLPATLPFVVGEPSQAPEGVYAVSPEAAEAGIKPGMSWRQAKTLCPQVRLVPHQPDQYQSFYNELLAALVNFTASIEAEQLGVAASLYLDLGRLSVNKPVELVRELGQAVRERMGLAPAVGLAKGKFPAHVAATSVKPNRASIVSPGREAVFLAPRSITLLPLSPELAYRFHLLGLRTLGQLAALPTGAVLAQFGVQGRWLHKLAKGYDDRPVKPHHPSTLEQITRQFDDAISNRLILEAQCQAMATELTHRLQANGQVGRELRLTLHLENGPEWTKLRLLRQATGNAERLGESLRLLLDQARISCGVVGITVKLGELSQVSGQQLDLFTFGGEQERRLDKVLPNLAARYGDNRFYQAAVISPLAYLPESRFQLYPVKRL
jgi:nucleotidyltransferase/DNA polymerase involved in DNA repair